MLIHRLGFTAILFCCCLPAVGQDIVRPRTNVQRAPAQLDQAAQDLHAAENRRNNLEKAITTFDELILARPPADLTSRQLAEWNEQTRWLESVRDRYQQIHRKHPPTRQRPTTAEMADLNMEFLALQNAVQMESRKFQTLSNASRARHDIAMAAIRNVRA